MPMLPTLTPPSFALITVCHRIAQLWGPPKIWNGIWRRKEGGWRSAIPCKQTERNCQHLWLLLLLLLGWATNLCNVQWPPAVAWGNLQRAACGVQQRIAVAELQMQMEAVAHPRRQRGVWKTIFERQQQQQQQCSICSCCCCTCCCLLLLLLLSFDIFWLVVIMAVRHSRHRRRHHRQRRSLVGFLLCSLIS